MKFYSAQSGYSLVETLVSIAILLIAFVGPLTIAAKALQTSYYAREQVTATFLAQEGIELAAALRNDAVLEALAGGDLSTAWDWSNPSGADPVRACFTPQGCNFYYDNSGNPQFIRCLSDNCTLHLNESGTNSKYVTSNVSGSVETPYTRTIKLDRDNDIVYVTSEVFWSARAFGGATRPITLHSAIYNIYD